MVDIEVVPENVPGLVELEAQVLEWQWLYSRRAERLNEYLSHYFGREVFVDNISDIRPNNSGDIKAVEENLCGFTQEEFGLKLTEYDNYSYRLVDGKVYQFRANGNVSVTMTGKAFSDKGKLVTKRVVTLGTYKFVSQ